MSSGMAPDSAVFVFVCVCVCVFNLKVLRFKIFSTKKK